MMPRDAFDKAIAFVQTTVNHLSFARHGYPHFFWTSRRKGERDPDRLYRAALGSLGTRL